MDNIETQLRMADRLDAISKAVGYSLWALQGLEHATAQIYVMMALATPGMGVEAAKPLLDDAMSKTFGSTVKKAIRANLFPPPLAQRFEALLAERNWLVHNSHDESRSAVHQDRACTQVIARVEAIAKEAGALMTELNVLGMAFVVKHGKSMNRVMDIAAQTLTEWRHRD